MALDDSLVIGIDLGTTNFCACYYVDQELKILTGGNKTPSYVFYTEKGTNIIGQSAKSMADQKPEFGVYDMKRFLGLNFRNPWLKEKMTYYQFHMENGKPKVLIEIKTKKDNPPYTTPQEIFSLILSKIKTDAEKKLKCKISKAVITVPAYFGRFLRQLTSTLAQKAGFTEVELLKESDAAVLSFYFENQILQNNENILIYSLGGGSFEVSVLKKSGCDVWVLCVDFDRHLGGGDFDHLIMDFVCEHLQKTYKIKVKSDKQKMYVLQKECEKAKIILSKTNDTKIILKAFVNNRDDVTIPFSRKQFEDLIDEKLQETLNITTECIGNSKITKKDIGRVLLAGRSTRIPKIRALLSNYFGRDIPENTKSPALEEYAVVYGAALQAAVLSSHPRQKIIKNFTTVHALPSNTKIFHALPSSIGIWTLGNLMDVFIKKDTPLPVTVTREFVYAHSYEEIRFKIYEGERADCRKNTLLGEVEANLAPSFQESKVTVTIDINAIGKLKCTVSGEVNGVREVTETKFHTNCIGGDSNVAEAIVEDAERNRTEDEKFKAHATKMVYLYELCEQMLYNMVECESGKKLELYWDGWDRDWNAFHRLALGGEIFYSEVESKSGEPLLPYWDAFECFIEIREQLRDSDFSGFDPEDTVTTTKEVRYFYKKFRQMYGRGFKNIPEPDF